MITAKAILDMYATIVIPKNNETIGYNPQLKRPYFVMAKWKTESYKYQYSKLGYSENLCLWIPPKTSLPIEFDSKIKEENLQWADQTEANIIKYGLDYCRCDHEGSSPYLWLFNIEGLQDQLQKKALAKLLIPENSKLDLTNLGQTLVPIIGHKHWKHDKVHSIIRGKNPLEHKNTLPKECKLAYENADKLSTTSKQSSFSFCDDHSESTLSTHRINQIINTDFKVQRLLSGDLGSYKSPSEARLALYCCLVAYGLTDDQVFLIMNLSHGLNFQDKAHLQQRELDIARRYVTKKREIICKSEVQQ